MVSILFRRVSLVFSILKIIISYEWLRISYDVITSKNGPLDLQQRHSFFVDRQDMGSNIELFLDLSQMDDSEWSIRNGHSKPGNVNE